MTSDTPIKTNNLSNRYEDLGLLGRGGMGEVRRVFDQVLGRSVAMKLINAYELPGEMIARFIEEAQVSARLQHPHILPIHDLGRLPDGRVYFTMKIAAGQSLAYHIKRLHTPHTSLKQVEQVTSHLSLKRLLSALKHVGDAVAYAHSCGVIHRDLKPLNVMLGDHGAVQLLDWGIAHKLKHYYAEWVDEVLGEFDITLTPTDELLINLKTDSASPQDPDRSNSSSYEDLITTLYAVGESSQDSIHVDHAQNRERLPHAHESDDIAPERESERESDEVLDAESSLDLTLDLPPDFISSRESSASPPHSSAHLNHVNSSTVQASAHLKPKEGHPLGEFSRFTLSSERLVRLRDSNHTSVTPLGEIAGTLHYMSPEQLRGDSDLVDPRTDVFGLGVLLYETLTGEIPFRFSESLNDESSDHSPSDHSPSENTPLEGEPTEKRSRQKAQRIGLNEKIRRALRARESPLTWPTHQVIPEDLKALCESALAFKLKDRLPSATAFSEALVNYLDGVGRRERALRKTHEAEALFQEAEERQSHAEQRHAEGISLEAELKASDPEELKRPVWEILDEARDLFARARALEDQAERTLSDALLFDHELREAHSHLTERALAAHQRAELSGDLSETAMSANRIRHHMRYSTAEIQTRAQRYLADEAPVTLYTHAPEASEVRVTAQRYELHGRRLKLSDNIEDWGKSPLVRHPTPLGQYMLTLSAKGYEETRYPISVERIRGWESAPPNSSTSKAVSLIPSGLVPDGFRYVPPGWFYAGGDPLVSNSVESKRRLWLDGFCCAIKHITHSEYIMFLNDLIARGEYDRAYHLRPRLRDEETDGLYEFSSAGVTLKESEFARLDWPANYTDYESALAYCEWRAERDGLPYRLPADMEWEKVARSVDARYFPWGDYFDPTFTHMRLSRSVPQPGQPEAWIADQSPWGHWALAGSMRDWTCTLFRDPFPYAPLSRVETPSAAERENLTESRVVRGGSWKTQEGNCRVTFRFVATPKYRDDDGGFRLAFDASALLSVPQAARTPVS